MNIEIPIIFWKEILAQIPMSSRSFYLCARMCRAYCETEWFGSHLKPLEGVGCDRIQNTIVELYRLKWRSPFASHNKDKENPLQGSNC